MVIRIAATHPLTFASGDPVRAASGVTRIGDQWLIVQDDATHAALWREEREGSGAQALRLFPAIDGADTFSEADGTKKLKPDVEAACTVELADGGSGALLLGSGSLAARMRAALVTATADGWYVTTADLTPLYHQVAAALGLRLPALNLEGACVAGDSLRWFQRGHAHGIVSAAVDVPLAVLVEAVCGRADPASVGTGDITTFDLGDFDGVPLAVTDAVALPDGRIILSAAAEDAPDAVEDGPVVASALAVVDGDQILDVMRLPTGPDQEVLKVEGLGLRRATRNHLDLLAVVDQDDPAKPSAALALTVDLG